MKARTSSPILQWSVLDSCYDRLYEKKNERGLGRLKQPNCCSSHFLSSPLYKFTRRKRSALLPTNTCWATLRVRRSSLLGFIYHMIWFSTSFKDLSIAGKVLYCWSGHICGLTRLSPWRMAVVHMCWYWSCLVIMQTYGHIMLLWHFPPLNKKTAIHLHSISIILMDKSSPLLSHVAVTLAALSAGTWLTQHIGLLKWNFLTGSILHCHLKLGFASAWPRLGHLFCTACHRGPTCLHNVSAKYCIFGPYSISGGGGWQTAIWLSKAARWPCTGCLALEKRYSALK